MTPDKNILMIAYYFHPALDVGSMRSVKFAKYLPEFGWKTHILTVKSNYFVYIDDSPLDFYCNITKTTQWPLPRSVYHWLKAKLQKTKDGTTIGLINSPAKKKNTKTPLWKRFINSLSNTPDDKIGWLLPAFWASLKLIRREKIDIIYSSGPPWTCHLIALLAKMATKKRWVADFRDPWRIEDKAEDKATALSTYIESLMLKAVIKNADLVLTTTPEMQKYFEDEYQSTLRNKCISIINGFDESDFMIFENRPKVSSYPIIFLYAGDMYFGRDPSNFLLAIDEIIHEQHIDYNNIIIDFYGRADSNIAEKIENQTSEKLINSVIKNHNLIPRNSYLEVIANAHVLILMQSAGAHLQIPAKTFDYLATGNIILALIADGATKNFLSTFDNVFIADPLDKKSIKDELIEILSQVESFQIAAKGNNIDIKNITKKNAN